MTTVQDLQKQFHCCMPLFIALGDKVRLSIVELLTEAAVRSEDPQGTIDFEGHAMNVNEITRRTSPVSYTHLDVYKRQQLKIEKKVLLKNHYGIRKLQR